MGGLQMMDGYQMSELHRILLMKSRIYLLHNMRPTESLWAHFISKEVLSYDMIDEIKACRTTGEKIGLLLDYLPARGPDAFDLFCEALLECDHAHVADYLKTVEATDRFRQEIGPHCADFSEHRMENFVSIFKKNTPAVQRFAERKFELILQEQEQDLKQREVEVRELDNKNMMLQLELSQLRSFLNTCYETSENISAEVQREFITRSFITEENKHLENLKISLKDLTGFEKITGFYENTQQLLLFLEKHVGVKVKDPSSEGGSGAKRAMSARTMSSYGRTIHEKLQRMANQITELSDNLGAKVQVPGHEVREGLSVVLHTFKELSQDVFKITDTFKRTLREKRKLEGEVLSLLHNLQEIRRLEREQKEKQSHIADLNKQGILLKKKTKQKKQLEQVQQDIERKKAQVGEIQRHLARHSKSADTRMAAMLALLPDLDDPAYYRSDTELTPSEVSALSRPGSYACSRLTSAYGRRLSNASTVPPVQAPAQPVKPAPPGPEIDKLHQKLIAADDEKKATGGQSSDSATTNAKTDSSSKANISSGASDSSSNSQGSKGNEAKTSGNKLASNPRLLTRRQKQPKPMPVHMRLYAIKGSKTDNKEQEEKKPKESTTMIGDVKLDEWLEKQQEQLRIQDKKLKEQQRRIGQTNVSNTQEKKSDDVKPKQSDENGNEVDQDTAKKDVNANDDEENPRQRSAEGSEKEKGWFEANKGSATSRSTGSRPPSVTRIKSIESDPAKDDTQDTKDTKDEKGSKDMHVSFKDFRYPAHARNETVAAPSDDRRFSNSKHTRSQTLDASNLGVVNPDRLGFVGDPNTSKLRSSFTNISKEMTAADLARAKSRQALQTSRVELRLPSK